MPDRIIHLPPHISNQIAAGEVIERPASVIKELLENSIDADSKHIVMRVKGGGVNHIYVADDGAGMSSKDALHAFDRHATSKISRNEDLFCINTLGFRGEALSSIASVAKVILRTRERGSEVGTSVRIEGGRLIQHSETGCPEGTEIEVCDLFYNVPARRKFLKSTNTELSHIINVVKHYALAYKELSLSLHIDDRRSGSKLIFPPVTELGDRLYQIFGKEIDRELLEISFTEGPYIIYGYISSPLLTFRGRDNQIFFVNRRIVKNATISHALQKAYSDLIPANRYPFAVLFMEVEPSLVDVNVHPTKKEIKFRDNNYVHNILIKAIRKCLMKENSRNFSLQKESLYTGPATRSDNPETLSFQEEIIQETHIPYIKPSTPHMEILTCMEQLFIVAMVENELVIIDQHAAHERIIYDRLNKMTRTEGKDIQVLLFPEIISLAHEKVFLFNECIPYLQSMGFDIEEIGQRSFMIRSIPVLFKGYDIQYIFNDMLDELKACDLDENDAGHTLTIEKILKAIINRKACNKAVKSGDSLSRREIEMLVQDLLSTEMPYTCPHGRPTMKKFSLEDLEKIFKRK